MSNQSTQDIIAAVTGSTRSLRDAVAGMTDEQLQARPIAGKWSTHEVVCHLADFEVINTNRIKRTLVEDTPRLQDVDPDPLVAALHYADRQTATELQTIEALRGHLATILAALDPADWQRQGMHSVAGPLTVRQLVENDTAHVHHHLPFIAEKRKALGLS